MVEAPIDKSFTCGILMSKVEKMAWDTPKLPRMWGNMIVL
jgi:hypothetical protein